MASVVWDFFPRLPKHSITVHNLHKMTFFVQSNMKLYYMTMLWDCDPAEWAMDLESQHQVVQLCFPTVVSTTACKGQSLEYIHLWTFI